MGNFWKDASIYSILVVTCCIYSLFLPFYPKLAQEKGLSLSGIGLMFSINPFANLISTLILGKYMVTIGRKLVLILGLIFSGLSLVFIAPLSLSNYESMIILTVLSRILVGLSISFTFISCTAIFATDYPGQAQIMIGRMEAAISIGFILGPQLGAIFYSLSLLYSCLTFSALTFIFALVFWRAIGELRLYKVQNEEISVISLCKKPVFLYLENYFITWLVHGLFIFIRNAFNNFRTSFR